MKSQLDELTVLELSVTEDLDNLDDEPHCQSSFCRDKRHIGTHEAHYTLRVACSSLHPRLSRPGRCARTGPERDLPVLRFRVACS